MKIPKYIEETLKPDYKGGQSRYEFDRFIGHEHYATGYTIRVYKQSHYEYASTLRQRVEKLKAWVERQPGGEAHILYAPDKTHHTQQYAIITIYDPVMQHIEHLVKE